MTKRARTRLSPLGVVLAFALVVFIPRASDAALISYDVAAGAPITISGEFANLQDVALFQFTLDEGTYNFSAITDSLGIGGFDPNLALYLGSELYTYSDGLGGVFYATVDDAIETDASFALVLTSPGTYTLALAHTGNEALADALKFTWDDVIDVAGELYNGATCETEITLCGSSAFSLNLQIAPVTSPVPEPGTLSLMALGSLATAALRRRRKAAVTTRQ